jgi:DNA-binding CsgD family transcriptional regulator
MAEQGEPLSERELAVLVCLVDGSTNREIAQTLDISPNTVKVHLRNIFTKLGVSSRTEATTVAIQQGLLTVPTVGELDGDGPSFSSSAEDQTADQDNEDTGAGESGTQLNWRWLLLGLVILIAISVGVVAGAILSNNGTIEQTPETQLTTELFIEEPMGSSNWLVSRSLPSGRANMAVAAIGLDLYMIGGEVDAGVVNLVDVFETDSLQWTSMSPKPTAATDTSAAVLFGEIYVPGGRLADGRATAVVEAYSPANDAWRPIAPLPFPIAGSLALSDGENLYVLGGWDGQEYLDSALVYDAESDAWRSLPSLEQPRAQAAGGVVGDRLYVIGGWDGQSNLTTCEYFDLLQESWLPCDEPVQPRAGAGAAVVNNNTLYLLGGSESNEMPFGEVYDLQTEEWRSLEMPMSETLKSWQDLGVVNVETRIYALGGRQGDEILDDSYVLITFTHRTFLPAVGGDS